MIQDENIIEKFRYEVWSKLSNKEKEIVILNTIQYEQQNMSKKNIEGIGCEFPRFADIHISFDGSGKNIGYDVNGVTKGYKIYLNDKFIQDKRNIYQNNPNQGIDAYTTLIHELQHIFQNFLIKESKRIFVDESLKEKLKEFTKPFIICNQRNVKIDIFSETKQCICTTNGDLQINPINYENGGPVSNIREYSNMFYVLRKTERDAFIASIEKSDKLIKTLNLLYNNQILYQTNRVTDQIMKFKDRYNCTNLSNQDIINLIDKCFENIYLKNKPENQLEESIMYDLFCIAAANKGTISLNWCNTLLDIDEKSKRLINNQYVAKNDSLIVNRTLFSLYRTWPEKFGEFPLEKQIKNTILAIYIAHYNIDELKPHIKDINSMKLYCLENIKKVLTVDGAAEGITNLFGREFYEDIKIANEKYPNASMDFKAYEAFKNLIIAEERRQENEHIMDEKFQPEDILIDIRLNTDKERDVGDFYDIGEDNIEH